MRNARSIKVLAQAARDWIDLAVQSAWGKLVVASLTRRSRVASCRHDGKTAGCYSCAIGLGFGSLPPMAYGEGTPINCIGPARPFDTSCTPHVAVNNGTARRRRGSGRQ